SIQGFEKELQVVAEKLQDDRHSAAAIKMTLGVLQYLRAAKGSAAPISVQFLHGAIGGLELFVREPAPTDAERSEVMDNLLGQFRRVKAEIQRMKPAEAPEPAVTIEPAEEPALEEILEEETILEEVSEEEPILEEIFEDEPILEELPVEEPIAAAAPPVQESALGEIIAEEPIMEEPSLESLEEQPVLEEISEEEPTLDAFAAEELTLESLEEEPVLEEISEEEPTLDDFAAEERTLEPLEEEPVLEEISEEEPTLDDFAAEELTIEPLEEEPSFEDLFEEEPSLEEISEEEPVLEPSAELAEIAPIAEAVPAAIPPPLQGLIQEVKDQSGQLAGALEALSLETGNFFDKILKAMAGKSALAKVEKHFGSVHEAIGANLANAKQLSGNLHEMLTKLEQGLGQQQEGTFTPDDQAAIDSQVKTIQRAVQSLSQVASQLQDSIGGEAGAIKPSQEGRAFKDAQTETEEFSLDSGDLMEPLGSDPVLDLVDEIPSEPVSSAPTAVTAIYLADVINSTIGIPAEAVTNVFKVSKGKAKAFRKKGYVKLADFKGAFRSIKKGVTGPLADLKVKDLKKLQFPIITLSSEILGSDDTEAVAPVKGIVLLSTGERHGALLTNEVMQRIPYDVKGYRKAGLSGEVSGTATIEGDFEINVVDPDYVLS
ncbi:MAG: hypothetical protein KJP05_07520, partial [Deltaproteobacteria bacterium]|nr:hypothetical protein [Deltaproteobacteria bacterium]